MEPVNAVSGKGTGITLDQAAVSESRQNLQGHLLSREDNGYDEARVIWNAMYDRSPAFIVSCASAADVVSAVNFARTHSVPVAVRSGGHNVAGSGSCDGGILLDLSKLRGIQIDSTRRVARVEPGNTWGDFDREAQKFGLATTGGICSQTGVAGVTLGGGFGWLMRKYGLSLDNVLSLEVVTADGEIRIASPSENTDLFFGLRGTHSNLGIVTAIDYRLHPVGPSVLAGMVLHPLERGKEVLRFYREFTSGAPEEMSAWAALMKSPDGNPMIAILGCYVGPAAAGEAVIQPLRSFGPPLMDMFQSMPYVKAQSMIDEAFPRGRFNYWKSSLLNALSDEAIDALVDGFATASSPYTSIVVEHLAGAMSRVPPHETAFFHRDASYDVVIMPMWSERADSENQIRWADQLWRAVQPFSSGGVYVNYLSNEGDERVRSAYGANYDRLIALKQRYDAGNLFRFNQNIKQNAAPRAQGAEQG